MPQPLHIPSLTLGTRIHDVFLVMDVEARTSGTGEPYTIITLGNSTGQIATAPFWLEQQDQIAGLRRGHAVQVIGEVVSYRDRKQIKVISIRHLPEGSVDLKSLLPSVGAVDKYWEALDSWRKEISKPRLKAAVDLFYQDDDFRRRYEQCPASVRGHHAAIGGLLKHTVEVAAIARTLARTSGADLQLVLAGALLHDIGKLESYTWDGVFDHTEAGILVGHVVLGALMLDRRIAQEKNPPVTERERDILVHFILSHHGKLEFGSPVPPRTLEAEVLHWADNASATTADLAETLDQGKRYWEREARRLHPVSSDWGARQED
jgi:3'-5' exoribonuclease